MKTTIDAMKYALDIISRTTSSAFVKTMLEEAIAREEAQTVEPVAHLKFWAYQQVSQDGNVNADEGLEVAKAGEIGMDGVAAFPVFTHPAPAQVTCQIYGHVVGVCGECNTHGEPVIPVNCGSGHCSCIECVKPAKPSAGERNALVAHWEKLCDPAILHANLLRGLPAQLSKEQLLHLLGTDAPAELAQQVAVPQGYVLVQASYLQELCSSIKGDCYRGTLWEIEAITTMLAAAPQPPQADAKQVIPKITVELPDGDQRTVKHWYKEWRNDEIVVSISIDEPQAAPRVPMTELEKGAAWLRATIDLPSPENCYLRGLADAESHHGVGGEP